MCMYFQCLKLSHASPVTPLKGNNFSLVEKLLLSGHTIGRALTKWILTKKCEYKKPDNKIEVQVKE